jgi:hypothetical protein
MLLFRSRDNEGNRPMESGDFCFNMKFKKVILVLTDETDQPVIAHAMDLCKKFKSKLFVLFVIESVKISRLARLTQQNAESIGKNTEEQAWRVLYLAEDEAGNNGIWTSLHFETGNMIHTVKKYIKAYAIDAVITKRKEETKKLFVSSPAPVIGL